MASPSSSSSVGSVTPAASADPSSFVSSSSSSSSSSPMPWTSADRWSLLLVIGIAAGVILPLLGATGFFDPWETNYAEVAREMVVRDDFLYPFWKDAHFFSKPVLLFWLTAPAYALLGAADPGPMPWGVELFGRLPSALIGIATVVVAFLVARRAVGRRAATLGGIVLATSPFWAFLSRQAITDMPYVGLSSIALLLLVPLLVGDDDDIARLQQSRVPTWLAVVVVCCVAPQLWEIARSGAFFDRVTLLGGERVTRVVVGVVGVAAAVGFGVVLRRRGDNPLLIASALCFALSMLAKGPVGFVLSVIIVVVVVAPLLRGVDGLLAVLRWRSLGLAIAVFVVVAAPWPLVMLAYDGLDESRKTWFQRFVLYDLLGRVG
ncbi:MAG TPA: glycosyltransferase family 39 protein, partial [Myxococcota bacterium]